MGKQDHRLRGLRQVLARPGPSPAREAAAPPPPLSLGPVISVLSPHPSSSLHCLLHKSPSRASCPSCRVTVQARRSHSGSAQQAGSHQRPSRARHSVAQETERHFRPLLTLTHRPRTQHDPQTSVLRAGSTNFGNDFLTRSVQTHGQAQADEDRSSALALGGHGATWPCSTMLGPGGPGGRHLQAGPQSGGGWAHLAGPSPGAHTGGEATSKGP